METSILKQGKDPMLPFSCRPISLLDSVGELLKKIPLTRAPREVKEHGLLRDNQNMSKSISQDKLVSISMSPVTVIKVLFSNSRHAFRSQE
jgi:hypothetical protein